MEKLSEAEIKSLLSKLFWDLNLNSDKLFLLLNGKIQKTGGIDRSNLYYRVLTGCGWYTILKLIPRKDLNRLLNDEVLNRIFPNDLRDKYLYARRILIKPKELVD